MRTFVAIASLSAALAVLAVPALADGSSARDIQAAVDSYVSSVAPDASLVGGPGSAGYDAGFWIRGGDFSLRINATLQARFEAIDWDKPEPGDPGTVDIFGGGGGDRSGFSLPRATLKFSGTAPCNTRYYMELEFGHWGRESTDRIRQAVANNPRIPLGADPNFQTWNFDNTREAWIEWGCSPALNFRMGQIKIPTTRQLMTPPELQQFIDISYASSVLGHYLPGYTDRNREFGAMVHGTFGCKNELSWMFAVTNGDSGDSVRNILDGRTDDGVAFSGRLNWAFLGATGYEEGALRQNTCTWYGEVGGWAFYDANRLDKPHLDAGDELRLGGDLQLGYGGLSFTGAFNYIKTSFKNNVGEYSFWTSLVQVGYLFPDTAWEIAARWGHVDYGGDGVSDVLTGTVNEWAAAINYYLNGHGNKLSVDITLIKPDNINSDNFDPYPGFADFQSVAATGGVTDNRYILLRFQWQLAL
jgi:hypothetical protein